ncbi:hypothetical protein ACU4GD_43000 [Cupriavidus basilensis]
MVADERRRFQCGAPAVAAARPARLEGGKRATRYRPARPPDARRLGHHHGQRVGRAGDRRASRKPSRRRRWRARSARDAGGRA